MGNLWIKVNYAELQVKMSKLVAAHVELQEFLDAAGGSETSEPAVCENTDCPNRIGEK